MALGPRLEMRQGQSMVLTPQLQQAIKMLQLSSIDLAAFVDSELEQNPLLEPGSVDDVPPAPVAEEADGSTDFENGGDAEPENWMAESHSEAVSQISDQIDAEPDALYPDEAPAEAASPSSPASADGLSMTSSSAGGSAGGSGGGLDGESPNLEAYLSEQLTLEDHVLQQLAMCPFTPENALIARTLIDRLDDAGYMTGTVVAIAQQLGATEDAVLTVLKTLQGFEPSGLFARSLAECLELQLRELDRYDPAMEALVNNLELLAERDLSRLKRLCGVDMDDLVDMINEIRALNPKPGMAIGGAVVQPVVPDILVSQRPDTSWDVQLNSETLPRVLVNQTYYANVTQTLRTDEDKSYLTDCLQSANWLVKSLEQRARTILKVSAEIIRQQDGFLTYGVTHLRPLNLKTVADAIGMHESTVSRVTSNKYMATPRGTFELKYFFTSSIPATGSGEAYSAEAVRFRIKEMIHNEHPDKILSDDTIVKNLGQTGIDIARRTVAKYRESMRIPSSVQRRREKQSVLG